MRALHKFVAAAFASSLTFFMALGNAIAAPFSFIAFGDVPYSNAEVHILRYMIEQINALPVKFVIHVGDFKSGQSLCNDTTFAARHADFSASKHPFIYLTGDNEWVDCHRPEAGGFVPVERLAALRKLFFATDQTLGQQPRRVERQAGFPENVWWAQSGDGSAEQSVAFIGLNVQGSNNNWLTVTQRIPLRATGTDGNEEFRAREKANLRWLTRAVDEAINARRAALVVAFQANPDFEERLLAERKPREGAGLRFATDQHDGFASLRAALAKEAKRFGKPILVIHGDTHQLKDDTPLRDANGNIVQNVRRLEVHGSPFLGWTEVMVDTNKPGVFQVEGKRYARKATGP